MSDDPRRDGSRRDHRWVAGLELYPGVMPSAASELLGVRAGAATFVVVDSIKPEWSLARKITIAVVAAALVSAGLILGLRDKPPVVADRPGVSAAQR